MTWRIRHCELGSFAEGELGQSVAWQFFDSVKHCYTWRLYCTIAGSGFGLWHSRAADSNGGCSVPGQPFSCVRKLTECKP